MSIGSGILLIVIGAILNFALDVRVDWIDLDLVGYILMGAGALMVIIGLINMMRRRSVETTARTQVDPATGSRVTRSEHTADPL